MTMLLLHSMIQVVIGTATVVANCALPERVHDSAVQRCGVMLVKLMPLPPSQMMWA